MQLKIKVGKNSEEFIKDLFILLVIKVKYYFLLRGLVFVIGLSVQEEKEMCLNFKYERMVQGCNFLVRVQVVLVFFSIIICE